MIFGKVIDLFKIIGKNWALKLKLYLKDIHLLNKYYLTLSMIIMKKEWLLMNNHQKKNLPWFKTKKIVDILIIVEK